MCRLRRLRAVEEAIKGCDQSGGGQDLVLVVVLVLDSPHCFEDEDENDDEEEERELVPRNPGPEDTIPLGLEMRR